MSTDGAKLVRGSSATHLFFGGHFQKISTNHMRAWCDDQLGAQKTRVSDLDLRPRNESSFGVAKASRLEDGLRGLYCFQARLDANSYPLIRIGNVPWPQCSLRPRATRKSRSSDWWNRDTEGTPVIRTDVPTSFRVWAVCLPSVRVGKTGRL